MKTDNSTLKQYIKRVLKRENNDVVKKQKEKKIEKMKGNSEVKMMRMAKNLKKCSYAVTHVPAKKHSFKNAVSKGVMTPVLYTTSFYNLTNTLSVKQS